MTDTTISTDVTESVEDSTDLFLEGFGEDESVEEEDIPAAEEAAPAEEGETDFQDTTEEAAEPEPEFIDYTYNHNTTQLPRAAVKEIAAKLGVSAEDIVTVLQKGSNYDALRDRQGAYNGIVNRIRAFADANDINTEDAINRAVDALDIIESAKYVNEIQKQYPNAPAKMVQEMALMRVKQNAGKPSQKAVDAAREAEAERERMWIGFFNNHQDVTAESLSPRMLQALERGENPEVVYVREQNDNLRKQIEELTQKQGRASRSTGSSKKTSGGSAVDAFLEGYLG